jgi:hypothetical protein
MKSRMTRERHVRFRESLGVKFPGATRPTRMPNLMDERIGDLPLAEPKLSKASRGARTPTIAS